MESEDPARPRVPLRFGGFDYALEATGALLLALFLIVAAGWRELPERVPIHFGFDGNADAWGNRSSSLLLPLIAVVLYGLLTVLSRFPHSFNYPVPITPENAETQYRLAIRLLLVLKNALIGVFFAIYIGVWTTAAGVQRGLSLWFLPVALFCLLCPIGAYLLAASRPPNR
jgi:hypothetical protein